MNEEYGSADFRTKVLAHLELSGVNYVPLIEWIDDRIQKLQTKNVDTLTAAYCVQSELRRFSWEDNKFVVLN
jgi:hypothetical protein